MTTQESDTRRFPQRRNGVHHQKYGPGVVIMGRDTLQDGTCFVKFDSQEDSVWVACDELTSMPSRGESPDPKTSRNSGWVGGNNYRRKK